MDSKKKAFSKYSKKYEEKPIVVKLNKIRKYCTVVRVIVSTKLTLLPNLKQKKNQVFEI